MLSALLVVAGAAAVLGAVLAWPRGLIDAGREGAWWGSAVFLSAALNMPDTPAWMACIGLVGFVRCRKCAWSRAVGGAVLAAALAFCAGHGWVHVTILLLAAAGVVLLGDGPRPSRIDAARWMVQCGVTRENALEFLDRRERRGLFRMLTLCVAAALLFIPLRDGELEPRCIVTGFTLMALRLLSRPWFSCSGPSPLAGSSFRPQPPTFTSSGPLTFDERPPDGSEQLFHQ